MVKTPSPKKKHPGRPAADPGDLRTARVAIRFHPDLVTELDLAARESGINRSVYVERILVNFLNSHAERRERPAMDKIGRYLTDEALERMYRAAVPTPTSFDRLRQSTDSEAEYVMPKLPPSHHLSAFGAPRRDPTGPKMPPGQRKPRPGKTK